MSVIISGRTFLRNGQRWSPKGLCYQPVDDLDFISDDRYDEIAALLADGGDWSKFHINALRVYQVDPTKSHQKVMSLLQSKGIEVMVGCVISTNAMPRDGSYPCRVLDRVKSVIDAFARFENVFCFSVSNELLFQKDQPEVAAAVKALVRDTKAYMKQKGGRYIPIGLALRDDPDGAKTLEAAHFYAAGSPQERADYIAYNQYRWCDYGPNPAGSMDQWRKLYEVFKDFPVPVMLGEYGCNSQHDRTFSQVPYLYGVKELQPPNQSALNFAEVVSGGFVFRYMERVTPEGNPTEYLGLVGRDGKPISGRGYEHLGPAYAAITTFEEAVALSVDPLPALPTYNPALPEACGGVAPTGPTISVTVTNEISPSTEVNWAYTTQQGALSDSTHWENLVRIPAGGSPQAVNIPTNATWVSVSYYAKDANAWYGGCRVAMKSLNAGDTIHGIWSDNGNGACTIS